MKNSQPRQPAGSRHGWLALSAFVATASVSVAVRAESLTYPAVECSEWHGAGFSAVGGDWLSGETVNNSTSAEVMLVCPIPSRSDAARIDNVSVTIMDRTCNGNVRCRLTSQWVDSAGTYVGFTSADMRSSGCSNFAQKKTVPAGFGTGTENLVLHCELPRAEGSGAAKKLSSLFSYAVVR